jgi:hypothetical protein
VCGAQPASVSHPTRVPSLNTASRTRLTERRQEDCFEQDDGKLLDAAEALGRCVEVGRGVSALLGVERVPRLYLHSRVWAQQGHNQAHVVGGQLRQDEER